MPVSDVRFRKISWVRCSIDRSHAVRYEAVSDVRLQCTTDDAATLEHRRSIHNILPKNALTPGCETLLLSPLLRLVRKRDCSIVDEKLVIGISNSRESIPRFMRISRR